MWVVTYAYGSDQPQRKQVFNNKASALEYAHQMQLRYRTAATVLRATGGER